MTDRIRAAAVLDSAPDMNVALQQARAHMDVTTRVLIADIGTALCAIEPTLVMREVTRLAYASRYAAGVHGVGTPHAVAATGRLLRHMPRVDWPIPPAPITRAEYGMQLLKKAGA